MSAKLTAKKCSEKLKREGNSETVRGMAVPSILETSPVYPAKLLFLIIFLFESNSFQQFYELLKICC